MYLSKVAIIKSSGASIYDGTSTAAGEAFYSNDELSIALRASLIGQSVGTLPPRTRSKFVKSLVCTALGYPVPSKFRQTKPKFPNQLLEVFVQQSRNLQIWNASIDTSWRYAIVRVDSGGLINAVRVISGDILCLLDKTGTQTQKYQARFKASDVIGELWSKTDTKELQYYISDRRTQSMLGNVTDEPSKNNLLSIADLHQRLLPLIGHEVVEAGQTKDRVRGDHVHRLVCRALGYQDAHDNGQFPDIPNQLLEVKVQTSPTIDLGKHSPDSTDVLSFTEPSKSIIRFCDVRYVVFHARPTTRGLRISNFVLSTGADFYRRFPRFEGKVVNRKLQIPLPEDFFDEVR